MEIIIVLIAGFFGGFFGAQVGGGAMVTFPALIFLGLGSSLAIGTNIISGWLINVVATARYWRSKKIDFQLTVPLSLVALIGSFIGSNLVISIDEYILNKIIPFFFIVLIFVLFIKPKSGLKVEKINRKAIVIAYLLSFLLGIYGGFFLVGVTTFFILLFVLVLRKDLLQAIANAVFITAIFLIGALIIFILKKNIDYSLAVPLAIASMIGSYVGTHIALKFGNKWLKFLILMVAIASIIKLLFGL